MPRNLTISVVITRNYGAHSVEFGMSETVKINSGAERRDCYNNLIAQLNDQISIYEHAHLSEVKLHPKDTHWTEGGSTLEQIPVINLVVENKQGKKHMSIQGGKYSKFGAPVYSDSCQTSLDLGSFDYGVHNLSDQELTATLDVLDGRVQRVVSIK